MQRQQRPDVQSFLSFLQQQQSAPPPPLGQCSGGMLPIPDTVTGVATEAHLLQQLREQLQGHLQPTVPPLQHTSSAEHLWGPHLAQQQAVQAHAVQQSQQHAAQVQQQQQHQQQNDAALSALHDMLQQQQQSQALFQLGGQLLTVMQYQQQQQQGAGAAVVGGQGVAGGTNVGGTGGAGGGGKTGGMGPLSGMVVPSGVFAGIGGGQDDAAHQSLVNLMSNLQQQQQQQLSGEEVGRESVQLQKTAGVGVVGGVGGAASQGVGQTQGRARYVECCCVSWLLCIMVVVVHGCCRAWLLLCMVGVCMVVHAHPSKITNTTCITQNTATALKTWTMGGLGNLRLLHIFCTPRYMLHPTLLITHCCCYCCCFCCCFCCCSGVSI